MTVFLGLGAGPVSRMCHQCSHTGPCAQKGLVLGNDLFFFFFFLTSLLEYNCFTMVC